MRALGVLLGKEFGAAFTSPIAYTAGTVFLLVLGYTFSLTLFATRVANLTLSLIGHFTPLARGSVFLSDVGYYVSLAMLAPFFTARRLAER